MRNAPIVERKHFTSQTKIAARFSAPWQDAGRVWEGAGLQPFIRQNPLKSHKTLNFTPVWAGHDRETVFISDHPERAAAP